jgi:sugar lactone lactonase YvrE
MNNRFASAIANSDDRRLRLNRVALAVIKTGKSYILTGLYNSQSYNALNDLTIDKKGCIYFTNPRYLGWEPMNQPVQAVYRSRSGRESDASHY